MKRIIFTICSLMFLFFFAGCAEEKWETDDITLTNVVEVVVDENLPEIYYFYIDKNFLIYENKNSLDKLYYTDWNSNQQEGLEGFSCTVAKDDNVRDVISVTFNTTDKYGKIEVKTFSGENSEPDNIKVNDIIDFIRTSKYI